MSKTFAFRFVGIVAFACTLSCATNLQPRPTTPLTKAPIVVPLTPNEPTMLGYLLVHDIWALIGKLGVQSMVTGAAPGFRFADLREGAVTSAFAFDPPPKVSIDHAPMWALLPTLPTSQLAQQLKMMVGALTTIGNSIAVPLSPTAAHMAADAADFTRLTAQPIADDVEVFFNIESYMARHGEELRKMVEHASEQLAKSAGTNTARPEAQTKMAIPMARAFFEQIEKLKNATLGFSINEDQVEISVVTQSSQVGAPRTTTDVSRFIEDGDVDLRYESSNDDYTTAWYSKLYSAIFAGADDAIKAKMDDIMKAQMNALRGSHMAASFSFSDGKIHGMMVAQLLPGKDATVAMRENALISNDPAMQKFYGDLGSKTAMTVQAQPAARKTLGYKIDHYDFTNHNVNGQPPSKDDPFTMLRNWSTDVAQVGPYYVYTWNEPPFNVDRVITALVKGSPLRPVVVGGEDLFLDGRFHVTRFLNGAIATMPKYANVLGKLDETVPPITFDGAEVGPITRYRVHIPRKVVSVFAPWVAMASKLFNSAPPVPSIKKPLSK